MRPGALGLSASYSLAADVNDKAIFEKLLYKCPDEASLIHFLRPFVFLELIQRVDQMRRLVQHSGCNFENKISGGSGKVNNQWSTVRLSLSLCT